MKELLNKYCLVNKEDTGLMLLDMPTGTGKTYNVLQFIKDFLKQKDQNKKIFFVTTLKKNLDDPYSDLLGEIEKDSELKDSDCIFRVLSNKEYAFKNFEKVKKCIKIKEIRMSDEFKSFDAISATVTDKFDAFRDIERNFRQLISKTLSRKFKTKEDKLFAIKNDNDWKWVGELYPIVFSEEKRVFFITMKKLINQFDTIVEKSVRLYESPLFRNSLVFIDEFDATKKDIQDMIVQNGLRYGIDYIDLFRNIKICLNNQESMPSNIFANDKDKRALEKNIDIFDKIEKQYHLLHHYKSDGFEEKRIILFSDYSHNNYITGDENVIAEFDKKKNINTLTVVNQEERNRSLYEALDKIRGAITHFAIFVSMLANSYRKNKTNNKEDGKTYGEFTEFHALDTILDSLHLQGESHRIIKDMALSITMLKLKKKSQAETDVKDDFTFYSTGFSHYDFCDDYSHDNTTIIRKFRFEETPESVLYAICSISKVIGISATATFNTVLGNYNIGYLKWKLGKNYYEPTPDDIERLKKEFEEQTEGADSLNYIVELTDTTSTEAPDWGKVFSDKELIGEAHNKCHKNDDTTDYKEVRYYKAVFAFKQFLDNDLQSYLALFSKAAKKGDSDFNLDTLLELFRYLSIDNGIEFKDKWCFPLDSENFDDNKKELIDALSKGERRFIISTYATIGAGQNLQYSIPDKRKGDVVKINNSRNDKEKEEMDIEGIYLDKPTSLVTHDGTDESAINRIFQIEYLGQQNAISPDDKISEIIRSYNSIGKDRKDIMLKGFLNLKDVKIFATKIIVQAMGRKCRTNYRGKTVCILADSELGAMLDYDTIFGENRLFNRELVELASKFDYKEESSDSICIAAAKNDAYLSNKRITHFLTRCFENSWNDEDIQLWENMRKYVLKHPTLTTEEWEKSPFKYHYISLGKAVNKYYYQQTGDFDSITYISAENFNNAQSVSEGDVNLCNLLKSKDYLRELFEREGYAQTFEVGDYIMSPSLYQNIYKGALGEVCGKIIFEHYGIPLEPLKKEEHELFDYKVSGKPIYVDFKYWKDSSHFDAVEYRKKVVEKAQKCGNAKKVIIANVRDTGNDNTSTTPVFGINIIELSLICKSELSKKAEYIIQELNESYTD